MPRPLREADLARSAVTRMPVGNRRLLMRPHGCFACGELNVSGLHLQLHATSGRCWAEPVLDEVMAWAQLEEDSWGVTARMAVDFRRPVPIGRRLRAEGRVVDRRRRLIHTEGRLIDPETGDVYATAKGTYVDAPAERKAELKERYEFRIEPAASAEEWDEPWPWPEPAAWSGPRRAGMRGDGDAGGDGEEPR